MSHDVKIVKLLGEFVWHAHPDTDEFTMVGHRDRPEPLRDAKAGATKGRTNMSAQPTGRAAR
jgi:hypothetical protein